MSLLLALALQGSLDARAREFHCADPQTQLEMNMCAGLDFERADAELNAAWRVAIAEARTRDREIDRRYDQRPTTEAKLREAQRAWLVFRDAHCTVQGYDEARGGSMEPMVYSGCRAALTRQRTAQLRGLGER
ncbi:MAG TPA: lysozyme inhibitor LprI family protein [Allosphingosinicella sp.]|nr:lysozyme inhibitor LprI family protein [Allosphingosinicella sp.]